MTSGRPNPAEVPALASPYRSAEVPGAMRSRPGTSSFALGAAAMPFALPGASSARYRQARMSPAAQNGTFTQNMNRQLR